MSNISAFRRGVEEGQRAFFEPLVTAIDAAKRLFGTVRLLRVVQRQQDLLQQKLDDLQRQQAESEARILKAVSDRAGRDPAVTAVSDGPATRQKVAFRMSRHSEAGRYSPVRVCEKTSPR